MPPAPDPDISGKDKPDGTEAKGLPDSGRDRTEAVLEKALPEHHQRKVRSGRAARPKG